MKVLITGGLGFIGHNVVRDLEKMGHECIIVDSKTNYGFIPTIEIAFLMKERIERIGSKIYYLDIRDTLHIMKLFEDFKPDCVIHLASFPRQKVVLKNPIVGSDVMMNGLITLLEASTRVNLKKFVYISSSMVYGNFKNNVKESALCKPIGQYGILKYAGEKMVEDYTRQGHFDHVIIRPSAVYGEHDVNDRVVSKFIIEAMRGETLQLNGPKEILDFTHVSDTAKGIALATTSENAQNKTYNITRSSRKTCTIEKAAQLAIKTIGDGAYITNQNANFYQYNKPDANFPSRGRLNISKAKKDFNYDPKIDIEDGFERYYDWLRESDYWSSRLI